MEKNGYRLRVTGKEVLQCCCGSVLQFFELLGFIGLLEFFGFTEDRTECEGLRTERKERKE